MSPPYSARHILLDSPHGIKCPARGHLVKSRWSWLPVSIILLAVYATLASCFYLVVALVQPRFGDRIGVGGLDPATATLLSALIAKTIELSYVTVCVAFVGQVLSRRALLRRSRGITIPEMNLRTWIMQPGSLLVQGEMLRQAAGTVLGVLALTAAIVSMLYTTAAEALVAPKLILGRVESLQLVGRVSVDFANPEILGEQCASPIPLAMDPDNRNRTCMELLHTGQAYHNYRAWLNAWSIIRDPTDDLAHRPPPMGSLWDNTTLIGQWIDRDNSDMAELSERYHRLVLNVTAAMPHGGVFTASNDPVNRIPQPQVRGEGNFELDAAVAAPAVNVLCAGMTKEELAPLVWTEWPEGSKDKLDVPAWLQNRPQGVPDYPDYLNRTVVDDLFGWGPEYGQRPPVFGRFPSAYNTVLNTTSLAPADSVFLLGTTPNPSTDDPPYVLCALKAKLSPRCSTHYEASATGANLTVNCQSPTNVMQYDRFHPDDPDGEWRQNWKNVASLWSTSLSLGTGMLDGASSNARLLMQLVPTGQPRALPAERPSVAEGLAVLAGSTLLLSTMSTSFRTAWPYADRGDSMVHNPVSETCEATLRAVGYASGGSHPWQRVFYLVLGAAFITSVVYLAFLLGEARGEQITDFTEPPNLFALALNSPASTRVQGACAEGPTGAVLEEQFNITAANDEGHLFIAGQGDGYAHATGVDGGAEVEGGSPVMQEYRRLARGRTLCSWFY
ncbi:hypothetical protein P168DRAFT_288114 [Aspergillus campestris IBT 28561]|uniref:Uncharacterized protein n=1 Tax=Aspergillus campestris (strain IBT 28561) TaxID=1392248 RepID=A0A2I1D8F0_ASPC2|nr:uncharacterized protein P168DRAFT_288114 [Aspergillus campestris IBT 28561]PKY06156.1 hypothetical protein P168DRAFT_288114 [Aspergillus campestris IBT 28561]